MIEPPGAPDHDDARKRRERLLDQLQKLHGSFLRTNRAQDFAGVRDSWPEVAEMLFCGRDLRCADLSGADLRNIDFRGSDLSGCDFSDARIAGARFELAKVSRDALSLARDWTEYRDSWEPVAERIDATPVRPAFFRRDPGERFSFSPRLPEVLLLPGTFAEDLRALDPEDRRHLEDGRLLIALRGLTNREIAHVQVPERALESDDRRSPWPGYTAQSYCSRLTSLAGDFGLPPGTKVTLPSYALFHAIATVLSNASAQAGENAAAHLADLQLGADGAEFVLSATPDGPLEAVTAGVEGRSARPLPPFRHGQKRAIIRPLFLLGEIR